MLWWEETLRWIESPSRRLLLVAYVSLGFGFLWAALTVWWLFVYQRIVLSAIVRDTDYVWQFTVFFGRERILGFAATGTPAGRIHKLIVFGKSRLEWKSQKRREPDPRRFRARMVLLLKEGPGANVHASLFIRRVAKRIDIARLFLRAGIGFPDPAVTGQAAAVLYPLTLALPRNERIDAALLPMFDRAGIDLDAEIAAGFRAYRVLIPWFRFSLHPAIIRFSWRWMFPRINEPEIQNKETSHGRQVLRNRIAA